MKFKKYNKKEEMYKIKKLENNIKEIIDFWDPIKLLSFAPQDEYDFEIKQIRNKMLINKDIKTDELALVIQTVFKNAFGEDVYYSDENMRVYIILCKLIDEFSKFNTLPFYLHKNFYTLKKSNSSPTCRSRRLLAIFLLKLFENETMSIVRTVFALFHNLRNIHTISAFPIMFFY